MTSGEEDYTKRVRAIQLSAPSLTSLIQGEGPGYLATDEDLKTENNTSDWDTYCSNSAANGAVAYDAADKQVGAGSLKWTLGTAAAFREMFLVIDLGATNTFAWSDFISIEIHWKQDIAFSFGNAAPLHISSRFDWKGDDSGYDTDNWKTSVVYFIDNNAEFPATGVWSATRLKFEAAHFAKESGKSNPCDDNALRYVFIELNNNCWSSGTIIRIDGLRIKTATGGSVYFKLDPDGHQQVDVLTVPNITVATLPSLPAGTNNIGDVDVLSGIIDDCTVTDITKTVLFADGKETTSGTKDLVTPGGTEKVQLKYFAINSDTDDTEIYIHEEDNAGHRPQYNNFLDGNIINANLVGCNYITTTAGKKLQMNISQNANVWWIVAYVLV